MHSKPKKRLGQNFLVDKNIQRKIVDLLELSPHDTILEIGSGRGELTGLIAERVNKIYALEIDAQLCELLQTKFKGHPNIKIINQDILKFNFKKFRELKNKLKVFGNIPYYISSPIIEHLLKFRDKIGVVFITVQKEFAARITALPGSKDYGSLSCFVQYYTQPKIILTIKKTCFLPQPKVDSCLVRLEARLRPCVYAKDEELFFKIIRSAFNQRRKTLRNSLERVIPEEKLQSFFSIYNLDKNIRPEDLSLTDFANLANI